MNKHQEDLSVGQTMVLHAILPIVIVGVLLPVGLVALFLGIDNSPLSEAVDRGELFLAGGNAAFTGCLVFVTARPDKALMASIVSQVVSVSVVLPAYAGWAYVSVASHSNERYSTDLVIELGLLVAVVGVALAMALVCYAFLSPPVGEDNPKTSRRSAIL